MTCKYISMNTIISQQKKKKRQLIIGAIIICFFGFGVIHGMTVPNAETRPFVGTYISLMLPGVLLLWNSFKIGKQIDAARRYETILSGDRDGIVTMDELTGQTGMDGIKVFSELETLFRKGYFQGCSLQREGTPGIIINDAMAGEAGAGFVSVVCPTCGASNRIRSGSRGQCVFCGAPINDAQAKK